jgi:hypothetical protein
MYQISQYVYNYGSGVHFNKDERFSDIFFDKFKNLLDDYIVNYQIKYFFYLLFISFFYLELSEGLFQLLHNFSPYHLSLSGSFIIDFCYSLFNIGIIDFVYSFFAFNLNSVLYITLLFSNNEVLYSMVVIVLVGCLIAEKYEQSKSDPNNSRVFIFFCFMYSFFFFIFSYMGFFSFKFYIIFTLALTVLICISEMSKIGMNIIDFTLLFIIGLMIISPYYIVLLFSIIGTYFFLNYYSPIYDSSKPSTIRYFFDLDVVENFLIFVAFGYAVVELGIASHNIPLFILTSYTLILFLIYTFRNEVDSNRINQED